MSIPKTENEQVAAHPHIEFLEEPTIHLKTKDGGRTHNK